MCMRNRLFVICLLFVVPVCSLLAQGNNLTVQLLTGSHIDTVLNHYLAGEGVVLSNGTFNNHPGNIVSNQIGTFNRNGFTQFPIESGLVMCTGGVTVAEGPNNSVAASVLPTLSYTESALSPLVTQSLNDCASVDFDFLTNSDTFVFRYVFASEEYCEYVNSEFNDIFAFFLTGPDPVTLVQTTRNVAIIPGSISTANPNGIPVAINNVNHGYHEINMPGPGSNPSYPQYFVHNSSTTGTQFDGYTVALEAGGIIQACASYHMKLSICDVNDDLYDSGVFLEEHSFESAPDPSLTMGGFYCLHDDIVFQYQAQNVDSIHLVTPSGNVLWTPPFVIPDALEADSGYYYLWAKKGASCGGNPWFKDSVHIEIHVPCVSELCGGAEACAGDVMSYPYAYDSITGPWVSYVNNNMFTISPPATLATDTTVFYALSMYDQFNCHFDTTVQVHVHVQRHIVIDSVVCNSCVWNGVTYNQSGDYTTMMQTGAGCDSSTTLHLTVHYSKVASDTLHLVQNQLPYFFAPADTTFAVNSPAAFQFVFTLPTQYQCDSVITQYVIVYQNVMQDFDTVVCASDLPIDWHGHLFTETGTQSDTLLTAFGADSVIVLHLTVNPNYEYFLEDEACEGGGYSKYGFVIPHDETVGVDTLDRTLTLQSSTGCDSIVHLQLTFTDTALRIVSLTEDFCESMSAELMVVTDFTNYVWTTGEQSPNITVTFPGVYGVTASQGGCRVTARYVVEGCDLHLYLPNAITPTKNDGLNDVFFIPEVLLPMMDDFEISIFDRWGSQVYYSTDKSFHWRGEVNDKIAVNSIFNYIIRYKNLNDKSFVVTGQITVL